MRRSWTIGQQITLAFALPVLMLVVLGSFSYRTSQQQIETSRWVAHTHAVIGSLGAFVSALKDAETGQRGFIITGKEEFLAPYEGAIQTISEEREELRRETADNLHQQRRLDAMQPLVRDKLGELAETLVLRRTAGLEAAVKVVAEGRGRQLMDEIRRIVADMVTEERGLLEQREAEAARASNLLTTVLVAGIGVTVLFCALAAFVILRGIDRQIGTTVQHMLSASAELQAAATQQAKGAKGQVAASTEVATTARELVATSRQIAESAQRVTEIAGDTATSARNGDLTVQSAHRAIELVKHHVDRIVNHMLDLGKRSQDIGGILDVINELSEQTNILAINATIEAAGAGDSGRRFAVVADEIRKLADRVAGSTKDIRSLIEEIRAAANTTVMATEDGAKAAEACMRQFGEVTVSLRRITDSVTTTADASREIELSTKQQTTAVEQVSMAMSDVAQTARETESSSGQTLDTAAQLAGTAQQLAKLIKHEALA